MATSSIRPKEIEFLYEKDGKSYYRLCKNIVEQVWIADFTGEKKVEYVYDMCDLEVTTINGLEEDIRNKFDLYWELAKKQTQEKEDIKRKKEKFQTSVADGSIVDNIVLTGKQLTEIMLLIE